VSADDPETAANVTIGTLGYRARCTKAGCGNLGRLSLRYANAGGPADDQCGMRWSGSRATAPRGSRSATSARLHKRAYFGLRRGSSVETHTPFHNSLSIA
jgi:hypothetical protein